MRPRSMPSFTCSLICVSLRKRLASAVVLADVLFHRNKRHQVRQVHKTYLQPKLCLQHRHQRDSSQRIPGRHRLDAGSTNLFRAQIRKDRRKTTNQSILHLIHSSPPRDEIETETFPQNPPWNTEDWCLERLQVIRQRTPAAARFGEWQHNRNKFLLHQTSRRVALGIDVRCAPKMPGNSWPRAPLGASFLQPCPAQPQSFPAVQTCPGSS